MPHLHVLKWIPILVHSLRDNRADNSVSAHIVLGHRSMSPAWLLSIYMYIWHVVMAACWSNLT